MSEECVRLTVPPDTKLLSVERLSDNRWAIWVLTNQEGLKRDHYEREGTYLLLNPDGSIDRTTTYDGNVVDLVEVMPPIERTEDGCGQG